MNQGIYPGMEQSQPTTAAIPTGPSRGSSTPVPGPTAPGGFRGRGGAVRGPAPGFARGRGGRFPAPGWYI
jgi:hypothetical protein